MKSNCVIVAFHQWFHCGGYLLVRKSHYGWWPHFAWAREDLKQFESFVPNVPNEHRRFPPLIFAGTVMVTATPP